MLESWETILKEYEGSDELLEFYPDTDVSGFSIGAVRKVYEEYEEDDDDEEYYADASVIAAAVNPDGEADGLLWFPLYNLSKVSAQTKYLKDNEELFGKAELADLPECAEHGLDALLLLSLNQRRVISIDLGEDDPIVYGIVIAFSESFVQMHCYTPDGEDDGISFIDKDRVEFCQYQGADELAVQKLI
ncbi:MAG: hypothetical protein II787_04940 [Lachnospiraceae bacterium]|nr:hypothetical protein [Lachnospiraceae bacterium]